MSWIFAGFMLALGFWLFGKVSSMFSNIDTTSAVEAVKKGWDASQKE